MFKRNQVVKIMAVSFLLLNIIWSWSGVNVSLTQMQDKESGRVLFSTQVWSSPETAAAEVVEALDSNPTGIFDFLSLDLQQAFGETAFQESIQTANLHINSVELVSPLELVGEDWAEFILQLIPQNSPPTDFKVILKNENGLWKIFGTQEIPLDQ